MLKPQAILEPVIKWSGSKRYVAPELSRYISGQKRYIEPFVGGGSMLPFRKANKAIASDIISELINLWRQIQMNPELVANEYQIRWEKLQKEGHNIYYEVRDNFNKTKNEFDFLFLTRTCVNGLIRYNANGEFNNSIHKNRPGINPKTLREVILKWSYFIRDVEFRNCDYCETLSEAGDNDFVFLDPPYGGTKDRYTRTEFSLADFYKELERLNSVGAKWVLTFDGTAGIREYDYHLPKELYKHKTEIKTGNSPFTKSMRTSIDAVYESD
ncbi:MAG: DNA adenine methylase, partial [Bacteroidetes bacterium]|nr:DNA adenine methylase [Bacteroidota bacterium]